MTSTRWFASITGVLLGFAPWLYWDGSFRSYDNSAQPNPQRLAVALLPFIGGVIGTLIDWIEQRSRNRS